MYTFSKSFANLDSFRRYLDNTPYNGDLFSVAYTRHSETGRPDWTGTESFAAADILLRDGDEENAKKLRAATGNGVNNTPWDGTRTRRFNAVCGGVANVPATVLGLPKSMIRTQKITYKDSKVLSIVYNASVDCSINTDEITRVSAALVSAVLGLEKKGYRINLYLALAVVNKPDNKRPTETVAGFIRIKDSGQYMDVKKMSYPLINPSLFRRHFFRFVEVTPDIKSDSWHHYGWPVKDSSAVSDLAKGAGVRAGKVVSFYEIRHKNPDEIMQFVLS